MMQAQVTVQPPAYRTPQSPVNHSMQQASRYEAVASPLHGGSGDGLTGKERTSRTAMTSDEMNRRALRASTESRYREKFIRSQERFVLDCASKAKHGAVSKHDDEWSIALFAFSKAIDRYDASKGDFRGFSATVIRNDIIDHYRARQKMSQEVAIGDEETLDSFMGTTEDRPENASMGDPAETDVASPTIRTDEPSTTTTDLKAEIGVICTVLARYGITFSELTTCSPKEERTKDACAVAVRWMLSSPQEIDGMRRTGKLPVSRIAEETDVPRKTLDRHRRYIVAVTEIFANGLSGIAEYLRFVGVGR